MRAALITGAAGLIGSHLCEAFAQSGWEVRALDKPGSDLDVASAAGAQVAFVELSQPEGALQAAALAKGASLVAHAAFPGAEEREEALATARAAMAAALEAGAPFLLLSSTTVYGRPRNLPCEEGEVKLPVDAHGETRWAVEREAFLWRRTRGLKLVVLRPALTYGPRQRRGLAVVLAIASLAARAGRALWIPRRGPIVHTVHAHDVAQAAVLVGDEAAAHDGRAFNVADDVPLPLEELARAVLQAVGAHEAGRLWYSPRPARFGLWLARHLPSWVLWRPLNRRIARAWRRAYAGQPPLAPPRLEPDLLEQLSADRWYDTQRLRSLGFSPRYPSAIEGLQQLALESRSRGLLPPPLPVLVP
ncbi:MAG: NAD-dependent epimerase/dehydratase family protein [Myxococcales bacterium]|nr:NAD(P)-dependent oxidoreductase [Myxococcales bacterium]